MNIPIVPALFIEYPCFPHGSAVLPCHISSLHGSLSHPSILTLVYCLLLNPFHTIFNYCSIIILSLGGIWCRACYPALFFRKVLDVLGFFAYQYKFRIILSNFLKNYVGIFLTIALYL